LGALGAGKPLRYWSHKSEAPNEYHAGLHAIRVIRTLVPRETVSVEAFAVPPTGLKNDQPQNGRPSLGKANVARFRLLPDRVFLLASRPLLAWQAYGDAARHQIASAASARDQQQLNGTSLDLDAVRRSIDGLAVSIGTSIAISQEQTTRSIDQLTAGLEQMTHEIAKLQAVEQYVLTRTQSSAAVWITIGT